MRPSASQLRDLIPQSREHTTHSSIFLVAERKIYNTREKPDNKGRSRIYDTSELWAAPS